MNAKEPFALLLTLCACGSVAAAQGVGKRLHKIALTGEPAPGVGTAFVGFETPFGFPDSSAATLDADGNAGVFGSVVDPNDPTKVTGGLWKEVSGALELVALRGDPAPGTGESFDGFPDPLFELPPRPAAGAAGFVGGVPSADQGFWLERPGGLELVVLHGQPLPGGPDGEDFHFPSAMHFADGSVLVESRWSTWRGDEGFWRDRTGTLELLVRAGSPAPGLDPGVAFQDADSLHLQGPFDHSDADPLGRIAFNGTVQGPGVTRTSDEGIWRESAFGVLELVVSEGDPAPGLAPGMRFGEGSGVRAFGGSSRVRVRRNERGTLLFGAGLSGGGADYVDSLWRAFPDGTLEPIAAAAGQGFSGTIQPGTGAPFRSFMSHASLNSEDAVAFEDVIPHPRNGPYNVETGIFWDQPGELSLLVTSESSPPGLEAGERIDSVDLGELLDDGSLFATAELTGGPRGRERALLFFEADGTPAVLVREGEVVDVSGSGDFRTVAKLGVNGFNQRRQFGLLLGFTDGSSGLFRLDVLPRGRGRGAREVSSPPRPVLR